eukprot:TRINITY_DN28259_c0_g1_i1.p1 TRINITY_DN28259_c0_g1~~TRINITY_DN28259_c0_g1_i1.p1  ORF type:complete len:143 (+),score=22.53 TRINITY_DN28259_c0_g1_i1:55-483(+)
MPFRLLCQASRIAASRVASCHLRCVQARSFSGAQPKQTAQPSAAGSSASAEGKAKGQDEWQNPFAAFDPAALNFRSIVDAFVNAARGSPIFCVALVLTPPLIYYGRKIDERNDQENERLKAERQERRKAERSQREAAVKDSA